MTIKTRSKFFFDYVVTLDNTDLIFNEGAGELKAELAISQYTPTNLAIEIARAFTAAGTQDYFCTFDRVTRLFTISAALTFDLLITSGVTSASGYALLGFTGADLTALSTYTSDSITGQEFKPQFLFQSYVDFIDNEGVSFATVKKTAQGKVEVVGFGEESFAEMNITFQTNIEQGHGTPIETDLSGVENLRAFMRYAIKKGPMEFMKDRTDINSFIECILESTPANRDGVAYKLKELYGKGLDGYFETGKIKLRKL